VKFKAGASYLEISVVVLVIILVVVAGINFFMGMIEKTRVTKAKVTLNMIHKAQLRHLTERGDFATSLSDLDLNIPETVYFEDPELKFVRDKADHSVEIATIERVNGASYVLHIDRDGKITCSGSEKACRKIDVPLYNSSQ
jgi:Tfp pilus assembly protein PilE